MSGTVYVNLSLFRLTRSPYFVIKVTSAGLSTVSQHMQKLAVVFRPAELFLHAAVHITVITINTRHL